MGGVQCGVQLRHFRWEGVCGGGGLGARGGACAVLCWVCEFLTRNLTSAFEGSTEEGFHGGVYCGVQLCHFMWEAEEGWVGEWGGRGAALALCRNNDCVALRWACG